MQFPSKMKALCAHGHLLEVILRPMLAVIGFLGVVEFSPSKHLISKVYNTARLIKVCSVTNFLLFLLNGLAYSVEKVFDVKYNGNVGKSPSEFLASIATFLTGILQLSLFLSLVYGFQRIRNHVSQLELFHKKYLLKRDKIFLIGFWMISVAVCAAYAVQKLLLLLHNLAPNHSLNGTCNYWIPILFANSTVVDVFYSVNYVYVSLIDILNQIAQFILIIWVVCAGLCYNSIVKQCAVSKSVKVLMKDHYDLSKLVVHLNEEIGLYVLVMYVSDIIWMLFAASHYVVHGASPAVSELPDILSQQLLLILRTVTFVFVTDKAQEVVPFLKDQAQSNPDIRELIWLNGEVQRLTATPPAFTVWGMARIDRPFIAMLVGTFATYLLLCWDS